LLYLLKSSLSEAERRKNPKDSFVCSWCSKPCGIYCSSCLEELAHTAIADYETALNGNGEITKNLLSTDRHPADDFCTLTAMCLIKLSISHRNPRQVYSLNKEVSYILQAIVLLEYAWSHSKSNFQLSLLLVRLYAFLGCGSQAMKAFEHLALKQIQLDTLSYVLLDRISSLHPLPFTSSPDGSSENPSPLQYLQKQQKVYQKARVHVIQNRWKAFENGSYNSIFQFQEFSEHITRTLSAGTSVIESRKISRILQANVPDEAGYDILRK